MTKFFPNREKLNFIVLDMFYIHNHKLFSPVIVLKKELNKTVTYSCQKFNGKIIYNL